MANIRNFAECIFVLQPLKRQIFQTKLFAKKKKHFGFIEICCCSVNESFKMVKFKIYLNSDNFFYRNRITYNRDVHLQSW